MPAVFSNNASAPLAASITASATTITVTTAQGALFPAVPAGSFFYATIVDSSNNIEIVKATARSGDVLTVVRAQEGTTARAFAAADKIELRVTAASLNNMAQLDAAQTFTAAQTFSAGGALAGTFTGNPTFSGNPVFSGAPNFSGAATATTAAPGTNTTQIATTAFVQAFAGTLGTMSTQNAASVAITGGTITGATVNGNTVGANSVGARTISTSAPSGGSSGDVWYRV